MTSDRIALYYGALLHDVGEVIFRISSGSGDAAELGAVFLEREVAPLNSNYAGDVGRLIVEQVRYGSSAKVGDAVDIDATSLAHLVRFADGISQGCGINGTPNASFCPKTCDCDAELRKIFNNIDGRSDDNTIPHESYSSILDRIREGLVHTGISRAGIDSLLNLLEVTAGSIPTSTDKAGLIDVSLYDHAKTTAGIAACAHAWLEAQGASDYQAALFAGGHSAGSRSAQMFLLFSCDMSGIQSFIYTISGSGALKQLRARSLYLELLLEHIADELLDRLGLCRANLLYIGGGHAYLLLPNTPETVAALESFDRELRTWFLVHYRTDLYLASAWVPCSPNDLLNVGEDSRRFPNLFKELARRLSDRKAARYSADTIRRLNAPMAYDDHSRECQECHRSDCDLIDGRCSLCNALGAISSDLVKKSVFAVAPHHDQAPAYPPRLPLPFGADLVLYDRDGYVRAAPETVRVYTKDSAGLDIGAVTHIWMGDYTADTNGEGISAYAALGTSLDSGHGIQRLGVLRADVDNLGSVFINGIPADKASISRAATLSRALSHFFKKKINEVLAEGNWKMQIVYSGGDDLFAIGNWSDVIHAAVAIRKALDEFTGNGALSISAGIGMFEQKYPLASMAKKTGELEDAAKMFIANDGSGAEKNAIALWSTERVFGWGEFIDTVVPRAQEVARIFDGIEKGKSSAYRLMELLRDVDNPVSIPRLAYVLARAFEERGDEGRRCSQQFYNWATDTKQRAYLVTALEWYAYASRER